MADIDPAFLKTTFLPIWELLEDDNINEIKVSPCAKDLGQIWAKTGGTWFECKNKGGIPITITDMKVNQIIEFIAGVEQKFAHKKENILEASIPDLEHRFTGVKQPTSVNCGTFNIRKHNSIIFPLEDYNQLGTFPEYVNDMLYAWMDSDTSVGHREKLSISIYGVTESGKSTFQNAYIDAKRKKYPSENWVILEDTRELNISTGNVTRGQCTEYTNMEKLLRTAKRQSPDNLVIGEVRSGEAALVIESALIFNTIFGMHAKDFNSALKVMERMILKNDFVDTVDRKDLCNITGWIGFQNIPVKIQDIHGNEVRSYKKKMTEMVELHDYDRAKDEFQYSTLYRYEAE